MLKTNSGAISNKKYEMSRILIKNAIPKAAKRYKIPPNKALFQENSKTSKRINVGILCIINPKSISVGECLPLNESRENIPIKHIKRILNILGIKKIVLFLYLIILFLSLKLN